MSKEIAPHLPYLRRFARALAGTQNAGDAYVAETLEVLIEDPSLLDNSLEPRVALYKTFLDLWNSVDVNLKPEFPTETGTPVDRKLESITPLPRQAFLLCLSRNHYHSIHVSKDNISRFHPNGVNG